MKRLLIAVGGLFLGGLLGCSSLWALGEEQFGNEPINDANYQSVPGIMGVINDSNRVYRWWVNGNEKFFFRGDVIALNDALEAFSQIDAKRLEVVLRPGPAVTSNFRNDQRITYNWHLHLIGGIAGHLRDSDQGHNVWPSHPMLYIYIGGPIQLSELEIPDELSVLQLSDLKHRYTAALGSSDRTVRGWACSELAQLDPFDEVTLAAIAAMLEDKEDWVRLNAAGALQSYNAVAGTVVDQLAAAAETDDQRLAQRVAESLQHIKSSSPQGDLREQHQKTLQAIAQFCRQRSP